MEPCIPVEAATLTPETYHAIVDQHADALFRFILRQVRDRDLARDLVQESFMRSWLKADRVCADKARSYLFTIAAYAVASQMRRRHVPVRLEAWHGPVAAVRPPEPDLHKHLDAGLKRLPPKQAQVITLRDMHGLNYEEIARESALNMAQVKACLHRARKAMRTYLVRPSLLV
jgi:RNA polymerase sigma-70 factor (ECF subfamily)